MNTSRGIFIGGKSLFFMIFMAITIHVNAQQWINQKYDYDSTLNILYGSAINFNGSTDSLTLDLFLPRCDDSSQVLLRPLLLFIHGGAFLAGDKNDLSIQSFCKSFASRGYVTASIDYRLGFVADDVAWNCNYPSYNCVFAADTAEWYRAYYRGVQDAKGALRFLVNRYASYRIDTANIFVAGESAGAFIALGVALLDTSSERPPLTHTILDAPSPSSNSYSCSYNVAQNFTAATIARPDLGGIDGDIEPTIINYVIKGVGNMYGGIFNNLLQAHRFNHPLPAIYSFHQPCDLVVPIDQNSIYWGLSWCMTNGYNCSAITNTPIVSGSRAISRLNATNNYGYVMQDDFTSVVFPYSYLLGPGSCLDQVNIPCHAYDNRSLREDHMAQFFSTRITTSPICGATGIETIKDKSILRVFPNPASTWLIFDITTDDYGSVAMYDFTGRCIMEQREVSMGENKIDVRELPSGCYHIVYRGKSGESLASQFIKL